MESCEGNKWWDECRAQVVDVFTPWGMSRHLKVKRHDGGEGISWDTLQAIKNDLAGEDVWMIEVFPPASEVVNEVNMRHLWEVPPENIVNMNRRG